MCPILFHLFGLPVYAYGTMIAVAFAFSVWHVRKLARLEGVKAEGVMDAAIVGMLSAIVGARLFFVLQPDEWRTHFSHAPLDAFKIWEGGLTFYGGLIGCFVTMPFVFRRHKMPFWPVADCFAPSVAIGHGIVRFGCFLNGCCYGKPAKWGIVMPEVDQLARQPSQLYESAAGIAIFAFVMWLYPRRRFHGEAILAYLLLYAVSRFLIEFTRGDPDRGGLGPLSTSQWVAVGVASIASALWPWLSRTQKRDAGQQPAA
ncbi:MAG: prolipoprotein diacylglyceryl transferase [Planctomycetes bacterium]|nr:prolipoprotein diacylglyceryl transferase [Planctomycetota bacterium]